jgi:hypothetical protein
MVTQFKKIKSRFKFFCDRRGGHTITSFQIAQPTKNYHGHSLQTVNKKYWLHSSQKSRFGFFAAREGEQIITFCELCNHYFLLTVCKLYLTTVSMTIFVGCIVQKKVMVCSLSAAAKKNLNLFFTNCVTITFY